MVTHRLKQKLHQKTKETLQNLEISWVPKITLSYCEAQNHRPHKDIPSTSTKYCVLSPTRKTPEHLLNCLRNNFDRRKSTDAPCQGLQYSDTLTWRNMLLSTDAIILLPPSRWKTRNCNSKNRPEFTMQTLLATQFITWRESNIKTEFGGQKTL
jgi:hypothetical protein